MNKWVPISNGNPTDAGFYLVTAQYRYKDKNNIDEMFASRYDGTYWYNQYDRKIIKLDEDDPYYTGITDILAYTTIPEHYNKTIDRSIWTVGKPNMDGIYIVSLSPKADPILDNAVQCFTLCGSEWFTEYGHPCPDSYVIAWTKAIEMYKGD